MVRKVRRYLRRLKSTRNFGEIDRHKRESELVQMAQAVEKQVAVEAKENSLANLKQNTDGSNLNGREDVGRSASKAAESIGVSLK